MVFGNMDALLKMATCILRLSSFPLLMLILTPGSEGRGFLANPPARASMWRYGFNTPINYDDNALNCGGLVRQWSYNQGKCGVCGDPYDGRRDNERGGKYSTDIVARTYTQGQVIKVSVLITANEGGWFQFYLCPDGNLTKPVTEQCLQQHLLELSDGSTRYHLDPTIIGEVSVLVKLPSTITCNRCVLRWMWNAGNAWGVEPDGKACVGCGHQEQFYGCSDITIKRAVGVNDGGSGGTQPGTGGQEGGDSHSNGGQLSPATTADVSDVTDIVSTKPTSQPSTLTPPTTTITTTSTTTTTTTTTTPTSNTPSTTTTTTTAPSSTSSATKSSPSLSSSSTNTSPPPPTTKTLTTTERVPTPPSSRHPANQAEGSTRIPSSTVLRCKAINDWLGIPAFDQWCEINCNDLNICLSKNCACIV